MKINYAIISAMLFFFFTTACESGEKKQNKTESKEITTQEKTAQKNTVYTQAGLIKIRDPKAAMVGYRKPGEDVFEISLDDVGKYMGHVCAGVSSGFLLTKEALAALYPNGELPVRGQISVSVSALTDPAEIAAYVTGVRTGNEKGAEFNTLKVDPSMSDKPSKTVLVFKRLDNGQSVKAVFDKSKLFSPEKMKKMKKLKAKIKSKTASAEERNKFAQKVQNAVKRIITERPEGLIEITKQEANN